MSDKFVKKQMYECSKCGKIFSSKDEVSEHYDKVHDFKEKYLGAYIMSNDGKFVGKVIREDYTRDEALVIEIFRFGSASKFLSSVYSTFATRYAVSSDELESNFKIVSSEIVREHLAELFIETGFKALKENTTIGRDFKELFETEYREKGGDDGN